MADHARMTAILTNVQQEFDDDGTLITATNILPLLNGCQREIAADGYWTKEATTNIVADQYEYALTTLFTDLSKVLGVWYYKSDDSLYVKCLPLATYEEFADLQEEGTSSSSRPYRYYIEARTLKLWPTPDTAVTNGLKVRYEYFPSDFANLTSAPGTPRPHDRVYEAFALWKKYSQDRTRFPQSRSVEDYRAEFEFWKRRITGDDLMQVPISFRPGR